MSTLHWHHRWNVLALTLLSQALVVGIQSFSFAFWIIPWVEEFHAPRSELMLIITASVLGGAVVSPFAGLALDRFSMRGLFCFGATLFAGTLIMISLANSHWIIMFLYGALIPIGLMLCGQLGSQILVARWFSTNRGFALGISALGISLGSFVMPLVVTALLPSFGWRDTFQLLAAATLVLLVPAAWFVLRKAPTTDADYAAGGPHQAARATRWTTRLLLCNRDFWIISAGFCALLVAYLPVLYSLGSYAHDLGISQPRAAFVAAMGAVTLSVGKLVFGKLSDIVEHRRLYQVSAGLVAVGIVLVSFADSFPLLMTGLLLTTLSVGSFVPLLSNMVVNRFGAPALGQVMGLASLFIQLSALSPFVAALIRDALGNYRLAFLTMLLPLLPAMIAMRWLSSRRLPAAELQLSAL